MKNDEIRQANRKALPKFLLFAIACVLAGGVIGYASGYGAANGGVAQLAGMLKEAGAFFGARIAPWLMLATAIIGACTLPPDLSECKEIARCVGWRG